MVEPEQTSIAEQRIGNHVPVTKNSNERVVPREQIAKHKIPVTTNRITEDKQLFDMVTNIRAVWHMLKGIDS
jgi:hypothetical protein